jgi:hypothetical protein
MKKHFFIATMALASVSFAQAQLKVSSTGNVGIKLPNETDNPLSALSVGGTGGTSTLVYLGGPAISGKLGILSVRNENPGSNMYYPSVGINSTIIGNSSLAFASMWGEATQGSSYSGRGLGLGVVGAAGNYSLSFGVAGALSSSTGDGAGILGQTNTNLPSIPAGRYAGYFIGDVVVTGTINGVTISASDLSYKQNIENVDGKKILNNILSLRPISYNLKQRYMEAMEDGKTKQVPVYDEKSDLFQKQHYGLIAQELKEIYPDLVYSNAEGTLAINYTGLVPLLIESVKELKAEIDGLKANPDAIGSLRSAASLSNPAAAQCKLYQNAPNPFSQATQIKVLVADNVRQAYLTVYDLQGKQLKQIAIAQKGESLVEISGSEFPAGIYLYALIADGQKVDLKQMILTE